MHRRVRMRTRLTLSAMPRSCPRRRKRECLREIVGRSLSEESWTRMLVLLLFVSMGALVSFHYVACIHLPQEPLLAQLWSKSVWISLWPVSFCEVVTGYNFAFVLLTSLHDFVPCPVSRVYSRSFRDLHKCDPTFDSSTTLYI